MLGAKHFICLDCLDCWSCSWRPIIVFHVENHMCIGSSHSYLVGLPIHLLARLACFENPCLCVVFVVDGMPAQPPRDFPRLNLGVVYIN